jgi:hypothetical protein
VGLPVLAFERCQVALYGVDRRRPGREIDYFGGRGARDATKFCCTTQTHGSGRFKKRAAAEISGHGDMAPL